MKQTNNRQKGQKYEAPRVEVINIETQNVLCASGMKDSSTESIIIEGFNF